MTWKNSTLCYLEKDGCYLMLHRVKKENDVNKDKWIGVGGKFEEGESPEECALREVTEETGYYMDSWRYRGIVTFVCPPWPVEYMHLFTCDAFSGVAIECDEGNLEWVPKRDICKLPIWKGDEIFLKLLAEEVPFFSLKLTYEGDTLWAAKLNGTELDIEKFLEE